MTYGRPPILIPRELASLVSRFEGVPGARLLSEIDEAVLMGLGVTGAEMRGGSRHLKIVSARRAAVWVLYAVPVIATLSHPDISLHFGKPTHSGVTTRWIDTRELLYASSGPGLPARSLLIRDIAAVLEAADALLNATSARARHASELPTVLPHPPAGNGATPARTDAPRCGEFEVVA
ncbi:MAG: hypothetical protein AAGB51_06105 [Planctomycetota bacterium]